MDQRLTTKAELARYYNSVIANGGEGVVLMDPDGQWYKHKPITDSEGKLAGVTPGKGRNGSRAVA